MMTEENVSLASFHTFRLPATAKRVITFDAEEEVKAFLSEPNQSNKPFLVIGQGSNLLFACDFNGTILRMRTKGMTVIEESDEEVFLKVAAGEVWDEVVAACVDKGWGGIENLSLIPGLTGAAPVQNIGAYGVEMKDVLHAVEAVDLLTGKKCVFSREACQLGYRESIFLAKMRGKFLVINVVIRLSKKPTLTIDYGSLKQELSRMRVTEPTIGAVREAVCRVRSAKLPDPNVTANAGSFFKNPVIRLDHYHRLKNLYPGIVGHTSSNGTKVAAAWLIEQCGWKGYRLNDAGVHPDQPLVLVNYGRATGQEILDLALSIRSSVLTRFGILLEPEVHIL